MNIFRRAESAKNKTLNIIFGSIAIGILTAATYLTFSHHPLANTISRWQTPRGQATLMNESSYFPVLTIFIIALPQLILLLLIKLLIIGIWFTKKEKPPVKPN